MRGHDHVEDRGRLPGVRRTPVLTTVALSRRLEREPFGPYERVPTIARWVPGSVPQVHRCTSRSARARHLSARGGKRGGCRMSEFVLRCPNCGNHPGRRGRVRGLSRGTGRSTVRHAPGAGSTSGVHGVRGQNRARARAGPVAPRRPQGSRRRERPPHRPPDRRGGSHGTSAALRGPLERLRQEAGAREEERRSPSVADRPPRPMAGWQWRPRPGHPFSPKSASREIPILGASGSSSRSRSSCSSCSRWDLLFFGGGGLVISHGAGRGSLGRPCRDNRSPNPPQDGPPGGLPETRLTPVASAVVQGGSSLRAPFTRSSMRPVRRRLLPLSSLSPLVP